MKETKKAIQTILSVLLITMLMVTVIIPPATADAASKITLKSGAAAPASVYTGYSYVLKVAGTDCKFYSSDKKIAVIGLTQGKMKPVAPGTVKITAKNKKTGKVVATKTFTVLQRATSVSADKELYLDVGQTAVITATKTPETSTDAVRFYSDGKTIATVGAISGKVTARAEGKTIIKVISKATKATSNSNKNNKTAQVAVYVGTFLEKVEQTRIDTLTATFKNDISSKDFHAADFTLTNNETKVTVPVAQVRATGNQTVQLTLYSELKDGKPYTLSYGKTSGEFTATDGIVTDLIVEPATAQIQTETPVILNTVDKNGVILGSYTKDLLPRYLDMILTVNDGFDTIDGSVYFYALSSTAKVNVNYHTNQYERVDGTVQEVGAVSREVIITAREKDVAQVQFYSIATEPVDFKSLTYQEQNRIALNDTGRRVYLLIGFGDGSEITDAGYKGYTLSSDDPKIFTIDSAITVDQAGGKSAAITPVKEGTANLIVKNAAGAVMKTLPITVMPERKVTTIAAAPATLTLSNAVALQEEGVVTVTLKDQYGEVMEKQAFSVKPLTNNPETLTYQAGNDTGTITFYAAGARAGTYTYTVSAGEKSVNCKVIIQEPNQTQALTYLFGLTDSVDNTIDADTGRNNLCQVEAYLAKCYGGVKAAYEPIGKSQLTIKSADGKEAMLGEKLLTAQITLDAGKLKIPTIAYDSATNTYIQLPAGTYTANLKTQVIENGQTKELNLSKSFKVTNAATVLYVGQVETSLSDYAPMGTAAFYFDKAFAVTRDGRTLKVGSGAGSYRVISVDAVVSGNIIAYKSATLAYYYNSGVAVQVTVPAINKTVRINLSYPAPAVTKYTVSVTCEGAEYTINDLGMPNTYSFTAGTQVTLRVYGGTATSNSEGFTLNEPVNGDAKVYTFTMPSQNIAITITEDS